MTEYRTTASAGGGLDFVISDGSMDRHGTRINPNGWDLGAFLKNPIALWAHGTDPVRGKVPIGQWENVRVEGGKLLGKLALAEEKTSSFVDEVRSLVKQGILRMVSVGFEILQTGKPGTQFEIERQELREASLVAVGSNKNALAQARALHISEPTIRMVFGEQAERGPKDATATGEHADTKTADERRAQAAAPPRPKDTKMTLSQRIEAAQADITVKRDQLVVLTSADNLDNDAIDELNTQIEAVERTIDTLKASELRLVGFASSGEKPLQAPALNRRPFGVMQRDVKPADLFVRAAVCNLLAHLTNSTAEKVAEERYPGHEATAAVATRTAIAVATTTTSGWASQLVETATAEFLALLPPTSIYPVLRDMGVSLSFGPTSGAIKIPSSSDTTALAGGFVLEGDPIPVGRMTLTSITLTPTKFGIIVPMTKEVMRYTNPTLESVVRSELLARTAITLDGLLIDSNAVSTTRPAGLLNGVSAAGTAYGGGDYQAFLADIKTLLAPFDTANAGRAIALLMNPSQARNVRMLAGPNSSGFGWANQFLADFRVIASTVVPAGTIIAVDTADFVTSTGDSPNFETSDQATIHMESSPSQISATGSPNTVAAPVRSMFQTNSVALKMTMDVNWAMRRTGMVQYLSGVTW